MSKEQQIGAGAGSAEVRLNKASLTRPKRVGVGRVVVHSLRQSGGQREEPKPNDQTRSQRRGTSLENGWGVFSPMGLKVESGVFCILQNSVGTAPRLL